jgi:hypothetical protein
MNLEELVAVHEIHQMKAEYVRTLDERRWDDWADLFTEDAVAQFHPAPGESMSDVHTGRAELLAFAPAALVGAYVEMRISSPIIDIIDSHRAKGSWAHVERLGLVDQPVAEAVNYGYYHEEYQKGEDGKWRISRLSMTRQRQDVVDNSGNITRTYDLA